MGSSCSQPSDTIHAESIIPAALPQSPQSPQQQPNNGTLSTRSLAGTASQRVGPHRPPAGSILPAGRRGSYNAREGLTGQTLMESMKTRRVSQIVAKAASGNISEDEDDRPLHSLRGGAAHEVLSPDSKILAQTTSRKLAPISRESNNEDEIITTTTVTVMATTVKRNVPTNTKATTAKTGSMAPRAAIATMLQDDATVQKPPADNGNTIVGGRRASLKKGANINIINTGARASPPPAGSPIITIASKSTVKLSPEQEKAQLQQLLKDMQNKTDTWISNLQAKQSQEAQQADLAAIQQTRETIAANRAQSTLEGRASMERKVSQLVDEKFDAFQAAVANDKIAANLKIEMDRKQKKMKEEEIKRTERMSARFDAQQLSPVTTPRGNQNTFNKLQLDLSSPPASHRSPQPSPLTTSSSMQPSFTSPSSVVSNSSAISMSGINFSPSQQQPPSASHHTHPNDLSIDQSMDLDDHTPLSHSNLNSPATGRIGSNGITSPPVTRRLGSLTNLDDLDEVAQRKAQAESNALKRAQQADAGAPILTNSGLPSAPQPNKLTIQPNKLSPTAAIVITPTSASSRTSSTPSLPVLKTSVSNATTATEFRLAANKPRGELAELEADLHTSQDAEAKQKVLEQRAALLPDGDKQKLILMSQARICGQVATVKRLEEMTAKRKEELFREQEEMKAFILAAKEAKATLILNHEKRRSQEPVTLKSLARTSLTTTTPTPLAVSS